MKVATPLRLASLLVSLCCLPGALAAAETIPDARQTVLDKRFHRFIPEDAPLEVLVTGLGWAEGPVWLEREEGLLFSDVADDQIFLWRERGGHEVFLSPSGHPPDQGETAWRGSNGLLLNSAGQLILAQQSARALSRMRGTLDQPKPDYQLLAGHYQGRRLNSPNDLVQHGSGAIYFSDLPYGLAGFENSPDMELDFSGVYRLGTGGELDLIDGSISKPNGLALSADGNPLCQ